MTELQIGNTDILYDMHGTVFKRKSWYGSEEHLIDKRLSLSYSQILDITNTTDVELEKKVTKVSFQPDFYFIQKNGELTQENYSPLTSFFKLAGLNTRDYMTYFFKYLFKENILSSICELREKGFNLEFQSGFPAKYAGELGRLLEHCYKGIYNGVVKPDDVFSPVETKVANIEQRRRRGRRIITIEDDPYFPDLFSKLWPTENYFVPREDLWDTLYKCRIDRAIADNPTQGIIYPGYQIEDVLDYLHQLKQNTYVINP